MMESPTAGGEARSVVATEDEATDLEETFDAETDVESEAGQEAGVVLEGLGEEETAKLDGDQDAAEDHDDNEKEEEEEEEEELDDEDKDNEAPPAEDETTKETSSRSAKNATTGKKANGRGAKKKGYSQYSLTPAQQQEIRRIVEDSSVPVEKRLKALRESHVETIMLQNGLEAYKKLLEGRLETREKELKRTVQVKNRLEALCRELQAHNKSVLAESKRASAKQEELRLQSNAEFQNALDGLSKKIESSGELEKLNAQLHKALEDASKRLKLVEEHHARQLEAKDIELQLAVARAAQQQQLTEGKLKEFQLRSQLQESLLEENKSLKASLESSQAMFAKLDTTVGSTDKALKSMRQEMKGLLQNKAKITEENRQLRERYTSLQDTHKAEAKRLKSQVSTQSAQLDKLKALARALKEQLDARDQNQAAN